MALRASHVSRSACVRRPQNVGELRHVAVCDGAPNLFLIHGVPPFVPGITTRSAEVYTPLVEVGNIHQRLSENAPTSVESRGVFYSSRFPPHPPNMSVMSAQNTPSSFF